MTPQTTTLKTAPITPPGVRPVRCIQGVGMSQILLSGDERQRLVESLAAAAGGARDADTCSLGDGIPLR
jgi:hypothetical protein